MAYAVVVGLVSVLIVVGVVASPKPVLPEQW